MKSFVKNFSAIKLILQNSGILSKVFWFLGNSLFRKASIWSYILSRTALRITSPDFNSASVFSFIAFSFLSLPSNASYISKGFFLVNSSISFPISITVSLIPSASLSWFSLMYFCICLEYIWFPLLYNSINALEKSLLFPASLYFST